MSNTTPNFRQGNCVLVPSSRCVKPCCEAEIKLKIISRAIRRKSSIEQLTHLLDCLVETKNGHGEMLPSGYHARFWLAREEGKVDDRMNNHKKPKVKKENKKDSKIGNNGGSQWTLTPPALENPNLESIPPPKNNKKSRTAAKGPTINGHKDNQECKASLGKVAAKGNGVAKLANPGPLKKRSAVHENKTSARKKAKLERGSEESTSIHIKRPPVFVFCHHCKKVRHLAPRGDKRGRKDIFRHECRNEFGEPVRVSQNLLKRSRHCNLDHGAGCIRLATSKEISDLQQKKRSSSTTDEVTVIHQGSVKKDSGALPPEKSGALPTKESGALPVTESGGLPIRESGALPI
jgi:hypothetical protein